MNTEISAMNTVAKLAQEQFHFSVSFAYFYTPYFFFTQHYLFTSLWSRFLLVFFYTQAAVTVECANCLCANAICEGAFLAPPSVRHCSPSWPVIVLQASPPFFSFDAGIRHSLHGASVGGGAAISLLAQIRRGFERGLWGLATWSIHYVMERAAAECSE